VVLTSTLFAFAFVAAPKSCEWGNEAYFWAGIGALVLLFAWPLVLHAGRSALTRTGLGVGFAVLGCLVWLGGLFAANFRIVCTLF
jgi:hypothetical protein